MVRVPGCGISDIASRSRGNKNRCVLGAGVLPGFGSDKLGLGESRMLVKQFSEGEPFRCAGNEFAMLLPREAT